jgi:hypothetical protein
VKRDHQSHHYGRPRRTQRVHPGNLLYNAEKHCRRDNQHTRDHIDGPVAEPQVCEAHWQIWDVGRVANRFPEREVCIEGICHAQPASSAVDASASDAGIECADVSEHGAASEWYLVVPAERTL